MVKETLLGIVFEPNRFCQVQLYVYAYMVMSFDHMIICKCRVDGKSTVQ